MATRDGHDAAQQHSVSDSTAMISESITNSDTDAIAFRDTQQRIREQEKDFRAQVSRIWNVYGPKLVFIR